MYLDHLNIDVDIFVHLKLYLVKYLHYLHVRHNNFMLLHDE